MFLFSRGNPIGPERLIKKLSGEISSEEAFQQWCETEDKEEYPGREEGCHEVEVYLRVLLSEGGRINVGGT